LADRILLAVVMLAFYGAGFALIRWTVGFTMPVRSVPDGLPLILFGAPLLLCLAFEWATGLWDHTPGTLGFGSLAVALPMLLSGATAALAFLLLRGFGPAFAEDFGRDGSGAMITLWGLATIGLAAVSLALWRFWPEPTARLF
jgi:hypothetical protein